MSVPDQLTDLHLARYRLHRRGKDIAVVSEKFEVVWNNVSVAVPEDFPTDFSSVPKFVPAFIASRVDGLEASVVHDFLYASTSQPKKFADDLFLEMMKLDDNVPGWRRWLMHQAVKRFGGAVYDKNLPPERAVGQDDIDD
ncbi:MAG: DUF1353 domain-containing protein [Rhodospirillales bacterium]|nr:DUF1353 domain-containing protein [Rhodospirillales bacterium]